MGSLIMGGAALLPAIVLFIYIYKRDKLEKEPPKLILKIIGFGVITIIGAIILEVILELVLLDPYLSDHAYGDATDPTFYSTKEKVIYNLLDAFVCAALCEEGMKWICLIIATKKDKNFNSLYDGIVYSVVISLTFAAIENVKYVFYYGFSTAVLRAFTAVPGHMFFSILMGIFYSRWHMTEIAGNLEKTLCANGVIQQKGSFINHKLPAALSLIVPVLVHGLYDFFCFMGMMVFFYLLLAVMYVVSFVLVSKYSKKDASDAFASMSIVRKKYPEIPGDIVQSIIFNTAAVDDTIKLLKEMPVEERIQKCREAIGKANANVSARYVSIAPVLSLDARYLITNPAFDLISSVILFSNIADGIVSPAEAQFVAAIDPSLALANNLNGLSQKLTALGPARTSAAMMNIISAAIYAMGRDNVLMLMGSAAIADGVISAQELSILKTAELPANK